MQAHAHHLVIVAMAAVVAACEGPPPAGPETVGIPQFVIVDGDDQSGIVGRELPDALVVRALDDRGRPLRGELVNFVVIRGGGSAWAGSSLTDKQGYAREFWTLGTSTEPGANRMEVRAIDASTGEKRVFATFVATGLPVPVGSVSVAPPSSTISVGTSVQLEATITSDEGEVLTDRTVTWASSDASVAEVSSTGLVTGVSDGAGIAAVITATAEGVSGTAEVIVTGSDPEPDEPLSVPETLTVPLSGTETLPISISEPAPPGGMEVTVISSDGSIVSVETQPVTIPEGAVSAEATLVGNAVGLAEVTVVDALGNVASTSVTVEEGT